MTSTFTAGDGFAGTAGDRSGRLLIVNADDFGQSPGVTRGIVEAHERGIVSSTSMMVRWPAAKESASYARMHPRLGVGLHLDFGEWAYRDGEWRMAYHVVPEGNRSAVQDEAERQLDQFRRLLGRDPTHLDSHQHAHRDEPIRSIVLRLAQVSGIPVRHFTPGIRYCGSFYGQDDEGHSYPDAISVEGLIGTLQGLPEGVSELGCHPGYADDLDTTYRQERLQELRTLCDPRVSETLRELGINVISFTDLGAVMATA